MIVSHAREFIFLKTRKTAGTSVEIALSRHTGPDDVVTRIGPDGESMRTAGGGRGAQNDRLSALEYRPRHVVNAIRTHRPVRAYNHMPAAEVRAWVPEHVWTSYTKFTIVRNPMDAAISFFYWRMRNVAPESRPSISEFLRGKGLDELTWNWSIYSIDDRVVADRVCRYESLNADLDGVTTALGLPQLELPRIKGGTRPDSPATRDVLSDADASVVRRRFAREIETFGYSVG